MKRLALFFICLFLLISCATRPARDFKRQVAASLQPGQLRYSFNITPENLKAISQCPDKEPTIHLINIEKINKDIKIMDERWCAYGDDDGRKRNGCVLNPHEVTDQIIDYTTESFRQCRVSSNDKSMKIINISFPLDQTSYVNNFNSSVVMKMNVHIPELNKSFTISTTQASFELHNAVAYAIHDMSWRLINDPTIQDYILCR